MSNETATDECPLCEGVGLVETDSPGGVPIVVDCPKCRDQREAEERE